MFAGLGRVLALGIHRSPVLHPRGGSRKMEGNGVKRCDGVGKRQQGADERW